MNRRDFSAAMLLAAAAPAVTLPAIARAASTAKAPRTAYRTADIDGLSIAYREAGDPGAPTVLLLHGFPTSSHMYRDLIPALAARYHVIAPDYPGFGASSMPDAADFDYSFANFARLMTALLDAKGVDRYAVYLMDYGAPVGFRMFAAAPERVTGMIIQNGNAYAEGLAEFWDPIKAYWADRTPATADPLRGFLTLDATKWQFTHGVRDLETVNPDNFWHVQHLLDRPGNQEVQLKLFLDYGTNVAEYPGWQALLREHQPPALLVWGGNDHIFPASGAYPYKRDLTDLEFHILDTGHFALEEEGPFIAQRMLAFLSRTAR
ncbi:MAG: pimeloyl-ACP methyl ester carboxylesterase [Paracoccaceae bacterium]|jgi:pimeloyl-ACP methyl ester carboxylesterase